MNLIDADVERYLEDLLPARDSVLAEMEAYAGENRVPIIGPLCGRLLHQMARLIGARRVFECGSAIGYSTTWFARALPDDGVVYYTDGDPQNAERARQYLGRAGVLGKVQVLVGDARDLIGQVAGEFDVVLIDVDKHQYPEMLEKAAHRVRRGGLLIADNVLWSGRVAQPLKPDDAPTAGIVTFNSTVYGDARFFPVIVPLRDGVAVCLRV